MPRPLMLLSPRYMFVVSLFGLPFVLNPCRRYLDEYNRSFTRARQGALGGHDDCYYQKLDYTVPLAFRGFFSFLQKRRWINTKQNAAFRFTAKEMETAKGTDLPDPLEHLGYTVRRLGSWYHTTREMDSIRIKERVRFSPGTMPQYFLPSDRWYAHRLHIFCLNPGQMCPVGTVKWL